jgi:hypothetical protein
MSLSRKIAAAVDAQTRADLGALPCPVTADDDGRALSLHLTGASPWGVAFDALEFQAAPRNPENLRAWADRLGQRLTYLLEPLVVLEHDRETNELEMRSQSPTRRDSVRSYYEVRLHGDGRLRLTRVAYDEQARARKTVSCVLTVEALERLTDDLVASAAD